MKPADFFDHRQINRNTGQTHENSPELPPDKISATINLRESQVRNHQEMLNELQNNNMNIDHTGSSRGQRYTHIITISGYPTSDGFNQHSILAIVRRYYSEASLVTE
ncbi:uncharacterized protein [Physcomitrium patens]|uniref:Uncharacterized protein n=1 Tax=Physcomitrium patens TaxID=3218 RepID=A0A2K1IEJ0_PHYPA|nr:uncharacterized protein LOC112277526 [Physcomitrium patens]PNR27690.1 hypothetical protein PHYPA_029842 [Physcomitrium patens]|eukprot:XP_024365742.1 uncharacterized protein LOC112277526 [Physcomitrella patens]